ncbi:MAG: DUF3572 domain-containing protein [Hyphomicrobiales bacterium]|nr:DUF3572 domain-containing protein [Hyphomicrobiales bacterium]MCP4998159.1 DUF3572 domain-containing protein [Hyphomicrobiales bacterium]
MTRLGISRAPSARFQCCSPVARHYAASCKNLKLLQIHASSIWLKKSKSVASNRNNSGNDIETNALGVDVLTWIAENDDMMMRFLSLSGLSADNLRDAAAEPGFMAGVVGFLMGHEPTLMAYCQERGVEPEAVANAWQALGGDSPFETSI